MGRPSARCTRFEVTLDAMASGEFATRSAEGSIATRPTRAGRCRTSRRCSTTTRSSPRSTSRQDSRSESARYVGVGTDTLDFSCGKCRRRTVASTRASTRTAEGARGPTTFGGRTISSRRGPRQTLDYWHEFSASAGRARSTARLPPIGGVSFADVASASGRSAADVEARWTALRPKLLDVRAARPRPRLDTKIVTAWNGLAIEALARGFEATGDAALPGRGDSRGRLVCRRVHRTPRGPSGSEALSRVERRARRVQWRGVLEDYAFFARGLVALFEATSDAALLDHALRLVKEADERFRSPEQNGWYGFRRGVDPFRTQRLSRRRRRALRLRGAPLVKDCAGARDAAGGPRAGRSQGASGAGERPSLERDGLGRAARRCAPPRGAFRRFLVIAGDNASAVDWLEHIRRAIAPAWTVYARVPCGGP